MTLKELALEVCESIERDSFLITSVTNGPFNAMSFRIKTFMGREVEFETDYDKELAVEITEKTNRQAQWFTSQT